jgi:hypothetical protein
MIESGNREDASPYAQTVIVTCVNDSRAHAVHDSQLATAVESGRYNAICGHVCRGADDRAGRRAVPAVRGDAQPPVDRRRSAACAASADRSLRSERRR